MRYLVNRCKCPEYATPVLDASEILKDNVAVENHGDDVNAPRKAFESQSSEVFQSPIYQYFAYNHSKGSPYSYAAPSMKCGIIPSPNITI
jgi:hypothetical protein